MTIHCSSVVVCCFYVVLNCAAQNAESNPGAPCGDSSKGLPDFYLNAVEDSLKPPNWRNSVIDISVGGTHHKLVLQTDGKTFELWTGVPDHKSKNIARFLLKLDQSCELPPDPVNAVGLLRMKWKKQDIVPTEFASLHRAFSDALTKHVSKAQQKYDNLLKGEATVHLDAGQMLVVYTNDTQHIELEVWDSDEWDPVFEWIQGIQKLADVDVSAASGR